jgi:glycosyltransferase involved in cell wall biosynthesis
VPGDNPSIAFLGDSLTSWTGGIEFLRICVSALHALSPDQPQKILLHAGANPYTPVAFVKRAVKRVAGIPYRPAAETPTGKLLGALNGSGIRFAITQFRDFNTGVAVAMERCHADAVFPCPKSLGGLFRLGWIGYIPDLQHKRLPQWFQEDECRVRDGTFTKLLDEAPAVVVNSASVVRDIREFYPGARAKLFSLPFCPPAMQVQFSAAERQGIRKAYSLPERYFIVSNQFWIHKSHETAFRALREIKGAERDVSLVCTGETSDYRWPEHFNHLKAVIEECGLQGSIRILGLIPKRDQLLVMSESLAVVQPTLFEGGPGGGAVYDAVSLNKPCIVSDIAVNREIDIGVVRFFTAGSAEDLAAKMIDVVEKPPEMPSRDEVAAKLRARQVEFGKVLTNAASIAAAGIRE